MQKSEAPFIILMAFLMSLVALAIDAMLPALNQIGVDLNVKSPNDVQLVISTIFFGMSFGLLLYGPISDSYGRKKPLYFGIAIFILGSFLSLISKDMSLMLIGRFLQGFGAAACRVISIAMIRDRFSGDEMARVMSLIMILFIVVPALAPSVGQLILFVGDWRSIFLMFIILSALGFLFLRFKQEETLPVSKRRAFSLSVIFEGIKETLKNPVSRSYTVASGLIFGAFIGYISSAQQILQMQYKLGKSFPIYFGALALCIGFSSFVNSKLVKKLGMKKLSMISLISLAVLSFSYFFFLYLFDGSTGLAPFLIYIGLSFLFIGILFGNLNTLALEPLGHIAGTANSVISSIQTFISVGIGG